MKRFVSVILVCFLLIASLTACKKTSGLYYDYDMSKYVALGKYIKTVDRKSDDYKGAMLNF